jgi:hypothetical protein
MDKDFSFDMLSRKQLLKLCSYYSLKLQGAMPNSYTSDEDLHKLVNNNLKVLEDGTIEKKEDNDIPVEKEIKLLGGAKIRMIII